MSSPGISSYLRYLVIIGLSIRLVSLFETYNGMWGVLYFFLTMGFTLAISMNNIQKIKDLPLVLLVILQFVPSNQIRLLIVQISCLIMALICGYNAIQAMNAMQIVEQKRLAEEEKRQQAEQEAYENDQADGAKF
mmetsp:Transcript_26778/g.39614  ORF Transcript_26778/g.39614 Transcript_26778/m.39614 type:complete len:135 (-) Transcript_26778:202-606(-)